MSLHCIIEPAGTLLTGWGLIPEHDAPIPADPRNRDEARPPNPREGDRTPPPVVPSKWELRKVG